MLFIDRRAAGQQLAVHLLHLRQTGGGENSGAAAGPDVGENVVVLGLPRGGVPVAFEVARALAAPMDVIVVRKLGVPYQPELGMGAIGDDGVRVLNQTVVQRAAVSAEELAEVERRELTELRRRTRRFRGGRPRLSLVGRTVLLVDDGIATGSTARAACRVVRAQGAKRVVLAAPIGSSDAVAELRQDADEVVCPRTARGFLGIGQWYTDFAQVGDEEVVELLRRAAQVPAHTARQGPAPPGTTGPRRGAPAWGTKRARSSG